MIIRNKIDYQYLQSIYLDLISSEMKLNEFLNILARILTKKKKNR